MAGEGVHIEFEAIEIVAAKGCGQNAANLFVIAGHFQFLTGAADREIIDKDLRLIQRPTSNAGDLSKFEIPQVLHADPNAHAQ